MEWIKLIIKTFVIILLQIVLFDRLQIQGWGYPMLYIVLLLSMPVQIPRWAEMLIGALVGLIIDICNNSLGVHIAGCVAISYIRPILLKNAIQDVERIKGEISSQSIGMAEFLKCSIILVIVHHTLVFGLEAWSVQNLWLVMLRALFSSILTLLLIVAYDFIKR